MILNILGQDYDYGQCSCKEDTRLADTDGYMDGTVKIIRVNNDFNENHPSSIRDFDVFKKKIIRHEIIHAFFEESGLYRYKEDELVVDWIAKQFSKMLKVFQQVEAL